MEPIQTIRGKSGSLDTAPGRVFTTTRWSMVIAAGQPEDSRADAALEQLCRDYWHPVLMFLQRSGWNSHDAEDLTQAFFERVLQKDYFRAADRSKGRFRTFLLAMLKHFVANHRRELRAQKRGGGMAFVSIDDDSIEERELSAGANQATPDQVFQRQWATKLLDHVVGLLHQEFRDSGKGKLFAELKFFLAGEREAPGYAELAIKLNTTEAALKMSVSRMRRRYGELLRAQIARTVSTPAEVDDELRALFAALR